MLFRSRIKPTRMERLRVALWPRRSVSRSVRYFAKRLMRLRASPHSIAAGLAAGAFVSVTPFLGFQFLLAFLLAYLVRGNLIAAAIGTNLANPLTVPLIWAGTLETGRWMLGNDHGAQAVERLVQGLTSDPLDQLVPFLAPMAVGSVPLGAGVALIAYGVTRIAVEAYQTGRQRRFAARHKAAVPPDRVAGPSHMILTDRVRLGVNIDHVATVRNARGGRHPDPVRAAEMAVAAGADGITAHLREDRRHIVDQDIARLRAEIALPLNLEMAASAEMVGIALRHRPHAACLVPEKREERTTEGGLDVVGGRAALAPVVAELGAAGIRVSLFVEPDPRQLDVAAALGAPVVELHTGAYCEAWHGDSGLVEPELARIRAAAAHGASIGLEVHAGHGLGFDTVKPVARIGEIAELNIGHFLVGEAIFVGLPEAIATMRRLIDEARAEAGGKAP